MRLPTAFFQPMASDEVAESVTRVAVGTPLNGKVEIGGPEPVRMHEFIRDALAAWNDPREVVGDPHAQYFGTELGERSLVPGEGALLGRIRYSEWPGRVMAGR